jgi:hypothetical protein
MTVFLKHHHIRRQAVWPYVDAALSDCQMHTSFVVAVGLVGDLCTALDAHIAPCVPAVMTRLLTALADPELPSVRPTRVAH